MTTPNTSRVVRVVHAHNYRNNLRQAPLAFEGLFIRLTATQIVLQHPRGALRRFSRTTGIDLRAGSSSTIHPDDLAALVPARD